MRRSDAKRIFDLVVSLPVFLLSLPLQAVVAGAVAARHGRPVLFAQTRPGLYGRPFVMRKFRTMLPVDEARGQIDDASRMTKFGRVLRSTSLDELPSLWNVIRGDMSLVGPRPLLMQYLPLYTPEQARRHEMRPGLTGLAQVAGRNRLSWEEKFRLDVEYIDRWTLALDFQILWQTVRCVLQRDGISGAGHVTMSPFAGVTHGPPGVDHVVTAGVEGADPRSLASE